MKKYRLNEEKLLRNILIILNLITIGLVVHRIATCGLAWISTCGYFG